MSDRLWTLGGRPLGDAQRACQYAAYIEWSKSHGSLVQEESFNSETYFKHVKFSASIQPWISQIAPLLQAGATFIREICEIRIQDVADSTSALPQQTPQILGLCYRRLTGKFRAHIDRRASTDRHHVRHPRRPLRPPPAVRVIRHGQ